MPITIKDVAEYANVSPSTVSRVLSDNPKISEQTKSKVREAMEKLNYKPNQIARSLINKSTRTLGLILPGNDENFLLNPFFVQAMRGIASYAKKEGYYILISHEDEKGDELTTLSDLLHSKWVDGVILPTLTTNDKRIRYLQKNNHPFVVIGKPENAESVLWVDNDNVSAMFHVVDLLIHRNHKTIAFIGGSHEFEVTKNRLMGYLKALKANGIPTALNLVFERDYTDEVAYKATLELLKYKTPDAIVTTDDLIAFGAQRALMEHNQNHVSIVGFNNTVLSQYKVPSVSSVDINAEKLGMYAAKLLISKIQNEHMDTNNYIINTQLIMRETIY